MIFQSRIAPLRPPPATTTLLVLQFALWLIHPFLSIGIGCNECTAHGEWWRIITSLFIHYEFQHFISNSLVLLTLGMFLESQLNRWTFLLLFLLSGAAGNILTYFIMPDTFTHTGASGAIFGLLGAQLYIFYIERYKYSNREQTMLLIAIVLLILTTFFGRNTNVVSHLGGLLIGGLCTPFLYKD